MQMDSNVNGKYLPERKTPIIPYFLQSKQIPNTQNHQNKIKKIIDVTKQFQEFTYVDQKKKSSIHSRINLSLKNTPKVILNGEENQKLTVLIECPKKLFTQNLKTCRKSVQVQKIIEIVQTLFQMVTFYGYFYCDKLLIRVSQDGNPVAWINQRFQQCERQFPIKHTPVSQLIFVKKLVQIFGIFISFPSQIETKQQINAFLEQQKAKLKAIQTNFPSFLSRKTSDLTQSLQFFEKQQLKTSIKSEMPKTFSTVNKNDRCNPKPDNVSNFNLVTKNNIKSQTENLKIQEKNLKRFTNYLQKIIKIRNFHQIIIIQLQVFSIVTNNQSQCNKKAKKDIKHSMKIALKIKVLMNKDLNHYKKQNYQIQLHKIYNNNKIPYMINLIFRISNYI